MVSVEAVARRALVEGLKDAPTEHDEHGVAMAVAAHDEWRAVFVLTLQPNGDWWTDLALFCADSAGHLEALSQGGGHGTGWKDMYEIAPDDFHGSALITLGSAGQEMDDASGTTRFVRGWFGFAAPNVVSVRAIGSRDTTSSSVSPIGNAFAIITLDENPIELRALDASGAIVGSERYD